jgi:hypothetical protein
MSRRPYARDTGLGIADKPHFQPGLPAIALTPGDIRGWTRRQRPERSGISSSPRRLDGSAAMGVLSERRSVRTMAAVFNLNHHATYVHWHFFQMSVSNVLVIAAMLVVFCVAILAPFPRPRAGADVS